jgi:thioredoxin 1
MKGAGVSDHILKLTDSTFDETISGAEKPVLVDFWAEWCGPCKMIAPVLEELATENGEKLQVAKLNVDDNPNVAMRYNVMSIPTLLVFKPGESAQEARRLVGAKSKAALLQELAEFVA